MTWVTDYFDSGTYGTKTTTLTAGVNTYYDKKFLSRAVNTLRLVPLGQKRKLPKGTGKTIEFFRYNNIAVSTTALTEGINPNATLVTGQKISRSVAEYGAFSQHSSLISATHIDRELAGVSELWGEHAANVIDLVTAKELASRGSYPIRGDSSTTYKLTGVLSSVTSSTVVVIDDNKDATNYGDTDHDLVGSIIVITSGAGKGQARTISAYTTAAGTVTVSPAFDTLPEAGDGYYISGCASLAAGTYPLTTALCREAVKVLRNNSAMTFDGYFVGVLCPDTEAGLMADTNWVNVMQYKDGVGADGLFTGEVGKWGGVRWVSTTQPFRNAVYTVGTNSADNGPGIAGVNYSATGGVYSNFILGKEAFGVTTFADQGDAMRPGIIVKTPGPSDTSNPLNRYSTVGWVMPYTCAALNPLWCVNIMTTK